MVRSRCGIKGSHIVLAETSSNWSDSTRYDTADHANRPALRFGSSTEYGGDDRGHRHESVSARSAAVWRPRPESGVVLRAQMRAGTIQSLDGTSHIGDRYILGQNSIRGFSFGGFGPRSHASDSTVLPCASLKTGAFPLKGAGLRSAYCASKSISSLIKSPR